MKKYKVYIGVAVVLGILILVKIFFLSDARPKNSDNAKAANVPVNVLVYIAKEELLDNGIFLTGTIKANEYVDLQPEIQGKITAIMFGEGQRVAKGQLLMKLNDQDLQAQWKKAKAQLNIAMEKEQRLNKLLEMKAVSQEEYDAALNQVQSLQAELESLRAKLNETEIRAPFSGTVGLRNVSVGSIVSPNTVVASLVQLDPAKLDFSVPEKYRSLVVRGDKINFRVEGSEKAFEATVYAVDPVLDEQTRSLRLRAICPNPAGILSPGSFARIELKPGKQQPALLIPTQAIIPELKGQKVYLVRGGKCEPVTVVTGVRTANKIEITKGLQVGDSVISGGIMQVKPGSAVKAIISTSQ